MRLDGQETLSFVSQQERSFMEHTKGKWIAGYGDTLQFGEVFGVGLDTKPNWTTVCVLSLPDEVNKEDLANARLIAAAPELLEALKVAEKKLEELENAVSGGDDEIYVEGAILTARAAIAKATGENK
jgi:hypothetical protein